MSDQHEHKQQVRYTLYLYGWLGIPFKRVLYGTGSSIKEQELLIFKEGGFTSIPYRRVAWMEAEAMGQTEGHSHP